MVPLTSRSLLVSWGNLPLRTAPETAPARDATGTGSKSTAARGDVVKDQDWPTLVLGEVSWRSDQRPPPNSPSHAAAIIRGYPSVSAQSARLHDDQVKAVSAPRGIDAQKASAGRPGEGKWR